MMANEEIDYKLAATTENINFFAVFLPKVFEFRFLFLSLPNNSKSDYFNNYDNRKVC